GSAHRGNFAIRRHPAQRDENADQHAKRERKRNGGRKREQQQLGHVQWRRGATHQEREKPLHCVQKQHKSEQKSAKRGSREDFAKRSAAKDAHYWSGSLGEKNQRFRRNFAA